MSLIWPDVFERKLLFEAQERWLKMRPPSSQWRFSIKIPDLALWNWKLWTAAFTWELLLRCSPKSLTKLARKFIQSSRVIHNLRRTRESENSPCGLDVCRSVSKLLYKYLDVLEILLNSRHLISCLQWPETFFAVFKLSAAWSRVAKGNALTTPVWSSPRFGQILTNLKALFESKDLA